MTTDIKRAAIIGCGRQRGDGVWRGMSRQHARGYAANGVEIVAVADIDESNARAFVGQLAPDAAVFDDFARMARDAGPDIVSVCTWPHLHAPMVIALAEVGVPAVHCEKPMATTWGDAKRMAEACERSGTRLTIGHQRRFSPTVRAMKDTIDSGRIGRVLRIEGRIDNLYDWGTHWYDALQFLTGDGEAEWAQAAVDDSGRKTVFGAACDTSGVAHMRLAGGASGVLFAGDGGLVPPGMPALRAVGEAGEVEVERHDGGSVRVRTGGGWEAVEVADRDVWADAIGDVVESARRGRESLLSAANALRGTELMFAAYHSARLHGARVELPLAEEGNGLVWLRERN